MKKGNTPTTKSLDLPTNNQSIIETFINNNDYNLKNCVNVNSSIIHTNHDEPATII